MAPTDKSRRVLHPRDLACPRCGAGVDRPCSFSGHVQEEHDPVDLVQPASEDRVEERRDQEYGPGEERTLPSFELVSGRVIQDYKALYDGASKIGGGSSQSLPSNHALPARNVAKKGCPVRGS